jgi:hypothetical protein
MTDTVKQKIKAIIGLDKLPEAAVRDMLNSALKGVLANSNIFVKPPIDMNVFGADIAAFEASIPAALDGSKAAVAIKNKLKTVAVREYVQLAHYVELVSNGDRATFLLAGFQAASTARTAAAPETPSIDSVVPGPASGQSKVTFKRGKRALVHDFRYGVTPAGGGLPSTWTEIRLGSSKPLLVSNLTPGTVYTFQVRAQGRLSLTDWSDPVSRMAV